MLEDEKEEKEISISLKVVSFSTMEGGGREEEEDISLFLVILSAEEGGDFLLREEGRVSFEETRGVLLWWRRSPAFLLDRDD